MRKVMLFLLCVFTLASCSSDDESISLSQNELNFGTEGGEQVIEINSTDLADYEYTEEWILVRNHENHLRVIVDPNLTAEDREGTISVFTNDANSQTIHVYQKGVQVSIEKQEHKIDYKPNSIEVGIESNIKFTSKSDVNWITVTKTEKSVTLNIAQNYSFEPRIGHVTILAGEVGSTIQLEQAACVWYDSFDMVLVKGGSFIMGAQRMDPTGLNFDDSAYEVESPIHKVTVNDFYICKFEITQNQWQQAMGNNPSVNVGDEKPVEMVTWDQVKEFIALLNEKSGKAFRLPTEAEWEFAARGGKSSTNNKYSGFPVAGVCSWYYSNSNGTSHEVGLKEPNELGIYDMSGNVREWCEDWFDYYTEGESNNPTGPSHGSGKINRGGSWTTPATNCRITYRQTNYCFEAAKDLGFRLVLSSN